MPVLLVVSPESLKTTKLNGSVESAGLSVVSDGQLGGAFGVSGWSGDGFGDGLGDGLGGGEVAAGWVGDGDGSGDGLADGLGDGLGGGVVSSGSAGDGDGEANGSGDPDDSSSPVDAVAGDGETDSAGPLADVGLSVSTRLGGRPTPVATGSSTGAGVAGGFGVGFG